MAIALGPYTFDTLAAAESVFDYSDPVGTGLQVANTARQWCWNDADTASVDVGPTSGNGGAPDGYVYTEASSPAAFDDVFYKQLTATLDCANNDNVTITWKTNQRGDDNDATCQLQTNEGGAGWIDRGSLFGGSGDADKVATAGVQIWSQRSVDISALGVNDASTAVRLVITFPSAGTSWHNDYGIDEFEVAGDTASTLDQEGFRFRNDDGSESAATWKQLQDVDDSVAKATNTRLRVLLDSTGDPGSEQFQLEYKETADGTIEYRKVPL